MFVSEQLLLRKVSLDTENASMMSNTETASENTK